MRDINGHSDLHSLHSLPHGFRRAGGADPLLAGANERREAGAEAELAERRPLAEAEARAAVGGVRLPGRLPGTVTLRRGWAARLQLVMCVPYYSLSSAKEKTVHEKGNLFSLCLFTGTEQAALQQSLVLEQHLS